MQAYLALLAGLVCAGLGGELFVRGAVGLAQWARIAPGIIGATVAAFATSSPELTVAVNSALAGEPEISLGDALGSNVVNVALILAVALVISGIQSPRDSLKRDFPVALLSPLVLGVLFWDGTLTRLEGFLLLALFGGWLIAVLREARRQRSAAGPILGARRGWSALGSGALGLLLLIAAGKLIVLGARGMAQAWGLDEFIIGSTVVAVGTSVPELATTLMAKLRKHDEVGLGTILGSNIFNGLFIIAVAAILHPITVGARELLVALSCGVVAVLFSYPPRSGFITRRRGVLLLLLYALYLALILHRPPA